MNHSQTHNTLRKFEALANSRVNPNNAGSCFSLRDIFHSLIFETTLVQLAVADALRGIALTNKRISDAWSPNKILLSAGDLWQLQLELYDRNSDMIHSTPCHAMIAVLGMQPLTIHRYPTQIADFEVFDPGYRLPKPIVENYAPGEIAMVDGNCHVVDVRVTADVLVAKFLSSNHTTLQWAFSRSNLQAAFSIAADSLATDLATLAKVLGDLRHSAASEDLLELSRTHEAHYVRWSALQALAKTAPDKARRQLRIALDDKHPHIREAAERALEKMN